MSPQSQTTSADMTFSGLTSDSRKVQPGFLFAALSGSKTDGARFVRDAIDRGASVVLGVPALEADVTALGVRFIADANPRLRLAKMAAEFYGAQPAVVAAVTGTKGKSSIVAFVRETWTRMGLPAASLGTVGVISPKGEVALGHTTPDPVEIHALLAGLKADGVDHLAVEASSHGLDQYRLDGVSIKAVGFTNITRDHMDYHPSFEHYLAAKLRLFTDVVSADGTAVINADAEHAQAFIDAAQKRGLKLITVGRNGADIRLDRREDRGGAQEITLRYDGKMHVLLLPLAGAFQTSNALVAAGLVIALGGAPAKVFEALEHLKGAPGRLEKVAFSKDGAPIYVDYAHTPDSLDQVLQALRPHTAGRLHVMFGCGGDRDRGKRPLMGAIAVKRADHVIITDDNPRTENAAAIRAEILGAAPGAQEIADRGEAIAAAVAGLGAGDVLILAGKGHESGQYINGVTYPFSDREEALKAALALGGRAA